MNEFDVIIALCMGIGLAAASGFRVFLPPFLLSIAVRADTIDIDLASTPFEYFDSNIAVILLGAATLIEFAGYYVPWVDNMLDTIASPAAVVAGTGMTALVLEGDTDPVIQWTLAIIAGGGVSAVVQGATVVTRGVSTMFTGGLANPVVSTGENIASIFLTIFAIVLAPIAAILVGILMYMIVKKWMRNRSKVQASG
ncbi:MAG: DUF4126 domain-containing protein [Candidatus Thalassarchaeaceae archaeon]|jgi:hypothetical protein|nr:DUF4126 domain-containing protein [Candidatus Thalassarchaeaceae archaeon]DAC33536.1 MAG TPA: DUF4126 domain-containing protein [Candidatus Poseidoniales archaeon]MDP6318252.1 DUF4126 domain-containing protein [Candidatus Thalassarchaeaceae archaeon]HIH80610.1 DUF4126 domain-containing protein [Candidatus Thalassarchaeaceae archaeon]HJM29769.1 DUF4126 domain-containing protein [Candidatus Thalassarchaeaceae archaeon]|tara:strand:- start:258 stop:848 length:591 start_codon:yes stop_codon:yes gene_type:complete